MTDFPPPVLGHKVSGDPPGFPVETTAEQPGPLATLVAQVAPVLISRDYVAAADQCCQSLGVSYDEGQELVVLQTLLRRCLDSGRLDLAAKLLWPPSFFCSEPASVSSIWRTLRDHPFNLYLGAASMGKTYTPGVMFLLEWLRDPESTNVICIGPSEEHLEANLFSHLIRLHAESSLPLPGKVGQRFIGLDPRDKRSSIRGVVIPVGRKAAGRVQGLKRFPRKHAHAVWGSLSRLFVLLDELENIPAGIYADLENLMSSVQMINDPGFHIAGSYNPKDITLRPGKLAEPVGGWRSFDPDTNFEWDAPSGWHVLRLDGAQCENVVSGRIIFPGLQTRAGFEQMTRASGGVGTPGYWTFCRGCYPKQGSVMTAVSPEVFEAARAKVVFLRAPQPIAGADLALEGNSNTVLAFGRAGLASGLIIDGKRFAFVAPDGQPLPRNVVELAALLTLPRGDTVAMAKSVMQTAQTLHVQPQFLTLDRTGNGAGVHDLLKQIWDTRVRGVNYSDGASNRRIKEEDQGPACDLYERMYSELVFAMRDWLQFRYLFIHPDIDVNAALASQVTERRYRVGKRDSVESKREFRERCGRSPDEADAVALMVHSARIGLNMVVQARLDAWANDMRRRIGGASEWMFPASGADQGTPAVDPSATLDTLDYV